MKHKLKMWFAYFSSDSYQDEPNFFSEEELSWSSQITSKAVLIKSEVEKMVKTSSFTSKTYFIEGLAENNGWKTFSFKTWGIEVKGAFNNAPVLHAIIKNNPNIVSVSINTLNPGIEIKPHYGDSNTFYRTHLGIKIPEGLPKCGFKVNKESQPWEENKLLTFVDGNFHTAWNHSNTERIIVVFDVIKDEFQSKRRYICFRVRSFLILQLLFEKSKRINNLPKWMHRIFAFNLFCLLVVLYPYQKLFGTIKKHN
ncbi:MAG: aspartyl/asparaginyl beta-hydroxylase domain-containing protein [Flavobacteriales bacterium]|nr:aspartyl/asparaginyl beta-hydroxylase domain-containing protein [Flavobacteriales bacterium]